MFFNEDIQILEYIYKTKFVFPIVVEKLTLINVSTSGLRTKVCETRSHTKMRGTISPAKHTIAKY